VIGASKSGLGRGLASLIPNAERQEQVELSGPERVLHSLAHAGLTQLEDVAGVEFNISAYVHLPRFDEPTLFLRRPALDSMSATRAFRLFTRIADIARSNAAEGTFLIDDLIGVYVRTPGTVSDGLHVIARRGTVISHGALTTVRTTCQTFATVTNQFAAGTPADLPTPRLVVEMTGDEAIVEATYEVDDQLVRGRGTGADATHAVAAAVLDAVQSSATLRQVREMAVDQGRAVLVLLSDAGRPRVGFVVGDDNLVQLTASATLRALEGR
jgi:hypothetical protein